MAVRIVLILTWLLGCSFAVAADPSNVLVGDLTFVRPEKWIWEAPTGGSSAVTRFLVPDNSGNPSMTHVRFYHGPKDPPTAFEVWKKWFPKHAQEGQPEVETINKRKVTYYRLTGTYVPGGNQSKRDHTLVGAVIPSAEKFVHVLLLGPSENVRKATDDLKAMIEAAVKEAE